MLVCPHSHLPLFPCSLAKAEAAAGARFHNRLGAAPEPDQPVLLRQDGVCLYAVSDGIPVLLAPEAYVRDDLGALTDVGLNRYAEAYAEMRVYNRVAAERASQREHAEHMERLLRVKRLSHQQRAAYPSPAAVWCDQLYEYNAQWAAYDTLAPLEGKRVLQMGGTGNHVLKFLLAGAAKAWLLTPMLGEAAFSTFLAEDLGLGNRFHAVVGIGEEMPFADGGFDGIYAGSCLHHMDAGLAASEARRVLAPAGVFAAIDPWLAPLHRIGTKLLGKREREVHCRPLSRARLEAFRQGFPEARSRRFGALLRYPLLGLQKFGVEVDDARVRGWMDRDERWCARWPWLRSLGSVVLITAERAAAAQEGEVAAGLSAVSRLKVAS